MKKTETVTLEVRKVTSTIHAILVAAPDDEGLRTWLPLERIEFDDVEDGELVKIEVPLWIVEDRGLEDLVL